MALKIRLRRQGRKNRPFYRIVVMNIRAPRDGKYVEALGWYDPLESREDKQLSVKPDRVLHWLNNGALPTEKVELLIKKAYPEVVKGFYEKKLEIKKTKKSKAKTNTPVAAKKAAPAKKEPAVKKATPVKKETKKKAPKAS